MAAAPEPSLVYSYKKGLYVNLTSRCPTACRFCIKFSWDYKYRGYNLKLPAEPAVADILAAAGDVSPYEEAIFCGYGESTYRLAEMRELSAAFRAKGVSRVRLNTIGLGNLIHGRNIAPDLGQFLDTVSNLPMTAESVVIRSYFNNYGMQFPTPPGWLYSAPPSYTLLDNLSGFSHAFSAGRVQSYFDVIRRSKP